MDTNKPSPESFREVAKEENDRTEIYKKYPFGCDNQEHMGDEITYLQTTLRTALIEKEKLQAERERMRKAWRNLKSSSVLIADDERVHASLWNTPQYRFTEMDEALSPLPEEKKEYLPTVCKPHGYTDCHCEKKEEEGG